MVDFGRKSIGGRATHVFKFFLFLQSQKLALQTGHSEWYPCSYTLLILYHGHVILGTVKSTNKHAKQKHKKN